MKTGRPNFIATRRKEQHPAHRTGRRAAARADALPQPRHGATEESATQESAVAAGTK